MNHAPIPDPPPAPTFATLYETFAKPLVTYALRFPGVSLDDAEDIVHDVFTTFLLNPVSPCKCGPYFYRAVHNAWLKRQAHDRVVRDWSIECQTDPHHGILRSTPESDTLTQECLALIHTAIATLPPRYRDVYQLRYIHDKTALQIATELKIMESSVHTYTTRAQRRIREALLAAGYEPYKTTTVPDTPVKKRDV